DSYASPYKGQNVATTGIVTAVDTNGSIGFWIEQPDATAGSGVGSRGLFVYTNSASSLPAVGDSVSVTGTMTDYLSSSTAHYLATPEINAPKVTVLGHGNAQPSAVALGAGGSVPPATIYAGASDNLNASTATLAPGTNALDFYRALQGQVVTIHDARVVGATGSGATWVVPGGIGTLDARGGIVETQANANTQRIEIYSDTGVKGVAGVTQTGFTAQVGDSLGDVTGVLTYYNGIFEVVPTTAVTVTAGAMPQQLGTLHADDTHMLIADYNVENMDALVDSNATRVQLLASIITTNLNSPDVLALQEIQDDSGVTDDGTVSAANNIGAIIRAIAAAGGPTYSYAEIDPANDTQGGVVGGNIRNVFLFNPQRVSLVGQVSQIGADQISTSFGNTRLPLVGTFRLDATGQTVTLVNVHNSSQAGSDAEYGSVQAPYDHGSSDPYGATGVNTAVNTRQAQAQTIMTAVHSMLNADPNARVAVLGDFNDVDWSTAQQIYTDGGTLTDLNTEEDASERYTYVFDGNSESLDHTLGSAALYDGSQFQTVHVNAEYADAQRESDHDPSVTLIDMTCFLSGTLIATPDGERPVERLVPGDLVSVAGGVARPVRWIGTRTVD
ncbi:Hint domain-containing protein, partial [Jatrophihabitans endophyticus]|uniref:Hint domain-containing protein n=1 Tax=Jatrophihabitans endophyticus TaxID=1206085 RepID=UPI001A0EE9EE